MKRLEKLRQRPKSERQKIAFGGAFAITLVIALIWLSVMMVNFNTEPQTAQVSGPIEAFVENVSNSFPDFSE